MKTKIILTIVAALAATVLGGCGQRNAMENTTSANPAQNQPASGETATNATLASPTTPAMANSTTTNK